MNSGTRLLDQKRHSVILSGINQVMGITSQDVTNAKRDHIQTFRPELLA
jgi:hypothetical protein